jgi:hypothetical protein
MTKGVVIRHFKLINGEVDVKAVIAEINSLDGIWSSATGRQERCFAQAETNSIPLRGLVRSRIIGRRRRDVQESRYTTTSKSFPKTKAMLEGFARQLNSELGRAKLARLPPGAQVFPHVDRGEYYQNHDRYHLVISSPLTSKLSAGGECAVMKEGELWWFDNKALHSARNETDFHRIHLIFDIKAHKEPLSPAVDREGFDELYQTVKSIPSKNAINAVGEAVRLYDVIRNHPDIWLDVLSEEGLVELAERKPIDVLARLIWPDLEPKKRKRRASSIGWALANMDIGRFEKHQVEEELKSVGGIRAADALWRTDRDRHLYGEVSES